MYVQGNIEARPLIHCCSRKETSVTYSERVFGDYVHGMQGACATLSYLTSRLYNIFPHYLINRRFKKNY